MLSSAPVSPPAKRISLPPYLALRLSLSLATSRLRANRPLTSRFGRLPRTRTPFSYSPLPLSTAAQHKKPDSQNRPLATHMPPFLPLSLHQVTRKQKTRTETLSPTTLSAKSVSSRALSFSISLSLYSRSLPHAPFPISRFLSTCPREQTPLAACALPIPRIP